LGHSQKTLCPPWCPKLVTGLLDTHIASTKLSTFFPRFERVRSTKKTKIILEPLPNLGTTAPIFKIATTLLNTYKMKGLLQIFIELFPFSQMEFLFVVRSPRMAIYSSQPQFACLYENNNTFVRTSLRKYSYCVNGRINVVHFKIHWNEMPKINIFLFASCSVPIKYTGLLSPEIMHIPEQRRSQIKICGGQKSWGPIFLILC